MRATRVHDTAEFLERTLAMRTADPVHLNVIGSVATGVLQGRTYDELYWFLVEDDDGTVVGAGAWTVPYHVLVSPMPDDAAHELGRLLAALPTPPVAVIGPPDVCFGVAATGQRSRPPSSRRSWTARARSCCSPTRRTPRATACTSDSASRWSTRSSTSTCSDPDRASGQTATSPSRRSSTVRSCGLVDADIAASSEMTPSRNSSVRCWSNVCMP